MTLRSIRESFVGKVRRSIITGALIFGAQAAFGHVTYSGRDFGTFAGTGAEAPVTISNQTVSSSFGWADGTDDDFADSHRTRAFRFALTKTAVVTINVKGVQVNASTPLVHPAFSVFRGICHVAPELADHDGTVISAAYLAGLPGPQPKHGAFRSLHDWTIGNDPVLDTEGNVVTPASLITVNYVGHKADGGPANYGAVSGIDGDGVADGEVTGTFTLPAGIYSFHVGGGDFADYTTVTPFPTFGIRTTVTVTADVTPPVITVPVNIVTTATSAAGAAVNFTVGAVDAGDGPVTPTIDFPSGSTFPIGTTTVHVSAADSSNNSSSSTFTVTVNPSTDTTLSTLSVAGATLSPAFDPSVLSYTATFGNATTSAQVTASATHPAASFVQSPTNPVSLAVGITPVTVTVTAQDGTTTGIYTVNLKRTGVDNVAPVVKITSPAGGTVTGTFDLSGTIKEAVGLAAVSVKLNNITVFEGPLATDIGPAIPFSVTGLVPENGVNSIVVQAVDYNGKIGTAIKSVMYINTRPLLAGNYVALLESAGTPNNDTAGLLNVSVSATGTFTGKATVSGTSISFSGLLTNAGQARFRPSMGTSLPLLNRGEVYANLGWLSFSVSETGLSATTTTLPGGGSVLASGSGPVSSYDNAHLVPSTFLNQPAGVPTKGIYNIAFTAKEQAWTADLSRYPQGSGYITLTVTNKGVVSAAGLLADGAPFSAASKLRADGSVPLFAMLYKKLGFASGELVLADLPNSDATGADLLWFRPANARAAYYPSGWSSVLFDAIGTKYLKPDSVNFGQGPASVSLGNATLEYTKGLLGSSVLKTVSIDPVTGAAKKVPANDASFTLSFSAGSGIFTGSFLHDDLTKPAYKGILLKKGTTQQGFGYFLSTPPSGYGESGESGKVVLAPLITAS